MFLVFYVLCRISELIERETAEYHKADPDPFDDRHPGQRTFLSQQHAIVPMWRRRLMVNDAVLCSGRSSGPRVHAGTAAEDALHERRLHQRGEHGGSLDDWFPV